MRGLSHAVVKVQRPDIHQQVMTDLEALTELAVVLDEHASFGRETGLLEIVNSLHDTLLKELDYRLQAENAVSLPVTGQCDHKYPRREVEEGTLR